MKTFFFKECKHFKLLHFVFLIFIGTTSLFAQEKAVTGKIANTDGEPLIGANVVVKGTSKGVISDFDGNYTIKAQEGDVLIFSYVGHTTQETIVGNQSVINASLKSENLLEEVVVIGYGTSKKSDLTGAISSVSAKDFEKQPISRIEDALQGRASGVQIIKNSGAPGADIKIRVRGANSISGNNQPLVVIDGVIGGDLRSINTNNIAAMEVLKDASATAIYGSRGANGVILITTKRGKGAPSIQVDFFTSASQVSKTIDVLSPQEFGTLYNLPVVNGGTKYQDKYFTSGITKNVQLALSGKKDGIGYFISGNIVDQTGNTINTSYKRYSLRSNLDIKVTDKLSSKINIAGGNEQTLNLISGGAKSSPDTRAGIIAVLGWDPTLPLKDENGNYNLTSSNGSGLINPIAQRLEAEQNITTNNLNASVNLIYDFTDNLQLSVIGGVLYRNVLGENYYGVPAGTVLSNPSGGGNTSRRTILQNSNVLTWTKSFSSHNVKATGLFEIQKFISKGLSASGGEYTFPANFYSLNLGKTPSVNANLSKSEIQSYMGRLEYNFDRKLYLTGTVRADVSSRFRPENQLGVFPSGSIAYQFRDLFEGKIDRLKLRAGYGEVGNQDISPYSTYNSIRTGQNYPLNGTSENAGIILGSIANPDLTWETTKQTNIGFDASMLSGRVNFTFNKYWKTTTDLLLAEPLPDYVGGGSITKNIGEVFNGGWEFDMQSSIVNKDKFSWDASLNFSYNQSEVKGLAEGNDELTLSPLGRISNVVGAYVQLKVGEPLGQFYGATYLGTYKTGDDSGTPGYSNFKKDENGDVLFEVIGNGVPTTSWALNNTFVWGNLDLSVLIRGVHDFDVYNFTRGGISISGGVQARATYGDRRNEWTATNQTDVPIGGDHIINSSRYLEKGDFIRLSNLSLGYNFNDTKWFKSFRVYASAQNLFTLTDYKGFDPEASSIGASNGAAASIDYGANPNSRTFTLGLKLGF